MFDNLEKKQKSIGLQKKEGNIISKKKAGRPRSPEKRRLHIKMPFLMHTEIKKTSRKIGMDISSFICLAVKEKLDKL